LHNEDKEIELRKRKEPGNKNMPAQKRFYSTKKPRKDKLNKLTKPSQSDKLEMSLNLITGE
jgi:hypothetical protein